MKTTKQIGWQKYEEVIKDQLSSPVLRDILEEIQKDLLEEDDYLEGDYEDKQLSSEQQFIIPIPENIVQEAALTSSFDCWVGHTNFNITRDIKNKIEQTEGIEMLKIFSRYRFFIGIGRMFDFKEVRQNIEKAIV
jgi:hypothetical protein